MMKNTNEPVSYSGGTEPSNREQHIRIRLNRNESRCVIGDLPAGLLDNDSISRYPDLRKLRNRIGEHLRIDSGRIVITAGGDEGIDRTIRWALRSGKRRILTHSPSFDMFSIYAANAGGQLIELPWLDCDFPETRILQHLGDDVSLLILVSPNNPTGRVIPMEVMQRLIAEAGVRSIPVLADLAYIEFADENHFEQIQNNPNVIVVRTFSKAWGLAGLRLGYLVAPSPTVASQLQALGGPFPVSGLSLELGCFALSELQNAMQRNVATTVLIRKALIDLVQHVGGRQLPSQANFVTAQFSDAERLFECLLQAGILVRRFDGQHPLAESWLRITCPKNWDEFAELADALTRFYNVPAWQANDIQRQTISPSIDASAPRCGVVTRKTRETTIAIEINLDGTGACQMQTGLGFFDHMLTAFAHHARVDLTLNCEGDLHVDDHHTIEDCALTLGSAIDSALGDRRGIRRFGYAYAPLDEALARTVIDLSGRAWNEVRLGLARESIGPVACENLTHFFQSLATSLRCALHVDVLRGHNDHHRAEAAFKSLALAFRSAISISHGEIPSTKGVL